MLSLTKTVALASCLVGAASAALVPTGPSPGQSFNEGSTCTIQYDIDTTGVWTNTTIQLMTGSNLAMVPLLTVVSGLDGTTGDGVITYTCPNVSPNAEIYFYQFQNDGDDSTDTWTGRFTIASTTGTSTNATETGTTSGTKYYWGTGKLSSSSEEASSVVVSGVSTATGAASAATSASATTSAAATSAATTSASSVASSAVTTSSSTSVTSSSATSTSATSSAASSSAAAAITSAAASGAGAIKVGAVGVLAAAAAFVLA